MLLPVVLAHTIAILAPAPVPETMGWNDWKAIFRSSTKRTHMEDAARKEIFDANLAMIEEHNAHHVANGLTYRLGVGQFTDMNVSEFAAYVHQGGFLSSNDDVSTAQGDTATTTATTTTTTIPHVLDTSRVAPIDWRAKGAVTPVKNQGGCGSCWAFSTTGAVEGHYQIATGQLRSLSEQQLVDCFAPKDGQGTGCQGGQMRLAFQYIIKNNGIDTEQDYNYTGENGECWAAATHRDAATLDGWQAVATNSEAQLAAAAMLGPVSVAIEADQAGFQHYKSGVFNDPTCGTKVDHGVLVVGLTDTAYIVKNSWGSSYGMAGYIQMARNIKNATGICGIATQASYPIKKPGTAPPLPPPTNGTRPGMSHYCNCPAGDGECAFFGQHCCCYDAKGDISCQQARVTSPKECCKPCTGDEPPWERTPSFMMI